MGGLWGRLVRAICSQQAPMHPPAGPSSPGSWLWDKVVGNGCSRDAPNRPVLLSTIPPSFPPAEDAAGLQFFPTCP